MGWGMEFGFLKLEKVTEPVLLHGSKILLILIISLVSLRVVKYMTRRLEVQVDDGDPHTLTSKEQRAKTLSSVINHASFLVISLITGMMILQELGFEIGPIIAGAGIAGLAIGFGAQSLVKDVIGGFFHPPGEPVRGRRCHTSRRGERHRREDDLAGNSPPGYRWSGAHHTEQ